MKKIIKPLFLLSTIAALAACNSSKGVEVDFFTAKARAATIFDGFEGIDPYKNSFSYEIEFHNTEEKKNYSKSEETLKATIKFDVDKHISFLSYKLTRVVDFADTSFTDIDEATEVTTYCYWDSEEGISVLREQGDAKMKVNILTNMAIMSMAASKEVNFMDAVNACVATYTFAAEYPFADSPFLFGAAFTICNCLSEEYFVTFDEEAKTKYVVTSNPGDLKVEMSSKFPVTEQLDPNHRGNATSSLTSNMVNYITTNMNYETAFEGKYVVDDTTSYDDNFVNSGKTTGKKGAKLSLPKDIDSYKPGLL